MQRKILTALIFALTLALTIAWAQKEDKLQLKGKQPEPEHTLKINHAKPDTVWVEYKQAGKKLMADVYVFSDQPIAGGQIPLKFGNGKSPLSVDSVVFDKARTAKFDITNDGIDNAQQILRIGFLADISGRKPPLLAGRGKLLTIYFDLKTDQPYEVVVDTATLTGGYDLLLADQAAQNIPVTFKKSKFKTK